MLCYVWEVDGIKDAYWKCHTQSGLVGVMDNATNATMQNATFQPIKARTKIHRGSWMMGNSETNFYEGSYEPMVMDDQLVNLCTTVHVNVDSCLGGKVVDESVLRFPEGDYQLREGRNDQGTNCPFEVIQ